MCPRVDGRFEVPFEGDAECIASKVLVVSWRTQRRSTTYTVTSDEKSTSVVVSGRGFILNCAQQCATWNSDGTDAPRFFVAATIAAVSDSDTVKAYLNGGLDRFNG